MRPRLGSGCKWLSSSSAALVPVHHNATREPNDVEDEKSVEIKRCLKLISTKALENLVHFSCHKSRITFSPICPLKIHILFDIDRIWSVIAHVRYVHRLNTICPENMLVAIIIVFVWTTNICSGPRVQIQLGLIGR